MSRFTQRHGMMDEDYNPGYVNKARYNVSPQFDHVFSPQFDHYRGRKLMPQILFGNSCTCCCINQPNHYFCEQNQHMIPLPPTPGYSHRNLMSPKYKYTRGFMLSMKGKLGEQKKDKENGRKQSEQKKYKEGGQKQKEEQVKKEEAKKSVQKKETKESVQKKEKLEKEGANETGMKEKVGLILSSPPPKQNILPFKSAINQPLLTSKKNPIKKSGNFKTVLCSQYELYRTCPYEGFCTFAHGPSELRMMQAKPNMDDLRRAKMFEKFFGRMDYYPNGQQCSYAHSPSVFPQQPANLQQLSMSIPKKEQNIKRENYKTVLCSQYELFRTCPYEGFCTHAHGPSELRPVKSNNKEAKRHTKLCDNFFRFGYCQNGPKCSYAHSVEQLKASPPSSLPNSNETEMVSSKGINLRDAVQRKLAIAELLQVKDSNVDVESGGNGTKDNTPIQGKSGNNATPDTTPVLEQNLVTGHADTLTKKDGDGEMVTTEQNEK